MGGGGIGVFFRGSRGLKRLPDRNPFKQKMINFVIWSKPQQRSQRIVYNRLNKMIIADQPNHTTTTTQPLPSLESHLPHPTCCPPLY